VSSNFEGRAPQTPLKFELGGSVVNSAEAPPDAILCDGLAGIADPPRLMQSANVEERKLAVNAFIAGITVRPDEARLDLPVRPLRVIGATDSTVRLVAGARYERVQIVLRPMERFVAGLRNVA
jgi:hypothetical protein